MLKKILTMAFVVLWYGSAFAAHPLITDDTGTQGKGNFLVEVNSELGFDSEKEKDVTTKERRIEVATILSYGITENLDLLLGVPYQWLKLKENGETVVKENGLSDVSLELKWRFYERGGLSFALKPGITFPTGDEKKGLGPGRETYRLFFITTKDIDPWAFHLNLGYIRIKNKLDERKDIWHASLAGEVEVVKHLKLVGNVGIERNTDKTSNKPPAFILGGMIYSITESFDIDFGIKRGLNKPETDWSILAGIAWRF